MSPDATVSVNEELLGLDEKGNFSMPLADLLDTGPNLVEVIFSDLSGEVRSVVMTPIVTNPDIGLIGRVIAVSTPLPGLTRITVEAPDGTRETVDSVETTFVRVPGVDPAFAADISVDDNVAILATESDETLRAIQILVKPISPILYRHFTGTVLGATDDQVTIMDSDGNVITADLAGNISVASPGRVITAVVNQDPRTGGLSVHSAESAESKITRLRNALNDAIDTRAPDDQAGIEARLVASASGHLTALNQAAARTEGDLSQTLEATRQSYESLLASFDLGKPLVKLSGVIQDFDRIQGILDVAPGEGSNVKLTLTPDTEIKLFGDDALPDNLEAGQRIQATYELDTRSARSIGVVFPSLADTLVQTLLPQVTFGELEGSLDQVDLDADPPTAEITLDSGGELSLTILSEDLVAEIAQLGELVPVKVLYDPNTLELLDIEETSLGPFDAFVSGVVKDFIPKIREGIRIPGNREDGNIVIATRGGDELTLNITDDTIIEAEGLRMTLGAVNLGDIVRPTSTVDSRTDELTKLAVRSPMLTGTVRGIYTGPSGKSYITISTTQFNLVTVAVEDEQEFDELEVGLIVEAGVFNTTSSRVSQLDVEPPPVLRSSGTISALDEDKFILALEPADGEPFDLLVPNKPGIITLDGNTKATFGELEVGDSVDAVFYRPNKVVRKLVVSSR